MRIIKTAVIMNITVLYERLPMIASLIVAIMMDTIEQNRKKLFIEVLVVDNDIDPHMYSLVSVSLDHTRLPI